MADAAAATMKPLEPRALADRLTVLWLAMGHAKGTDQAKAWLHEMTRLLIDLPGGILLEAIDEAVKQSDRGFLPSVGAVRKIAEPAVEERRRKVARLDAMARLQESGAQVKPAARIGVAGSERTEAEALSPAEVPEANRLMKRFGAATRYRADGTPFQLQPGDLDPCEPEQPAEAAA